MARTYIDNRKRIIKTRQQTISNHSYIMEGFSVGDIVKDIHYPDRVGVIIKLSRSAATVQWQTTNIRTPYYLSTLETVWLTYLEKIEGEAIFDDIDDYEIRKTVALEMRKK
jgi:hypothetical protein